MAEDGHVNPPLDIDRHWSAKGRDSYENVAAKLLEWAAGASSQEVQTQFVLLAALYEQLARKAEKLSDTYLPMDLTGEFSAGE